MSQSATTPSSEILYRKRLKRGRIGTQVRVLRGEPLRITKVVGVIDRYGSLVDPASYTLRRGQGQSSGVLYFNQPVCSAGMTILFEAVSLAEKHARLAWQRRVAQKMVAKGLTLREVAHVLGINWKQVEGYVG